MEKMQQPRLFAVLPDYVSTPDGMAIDSDGNLTLACPNYADLSMPGCILKMRTSRSPTRWKIGTSSPPSSLATGTSSTGRKASRWTRRATSTWATSDGPDTDGLHGELDQPGEPIIWNGRLILTCFDLVTGPQMVNTKHEMPATLSEIDLP